MSVPASSSGLKSADAAIVATSARLLGVELIGDGTNTCSVIIYDNASAASGTVMAKLSLPASSLTFIDANVPVGGLICNNGIYADVSGIGANYIVHYALS